MDIDNRESETNGVIARRDALQKRLEARLAPGEVDPYVSMKTEVVMPALDDAVRWFAEGNRGICIDCRDPIPEQRMMVMPSAIRCIECQEEKEKENAKVSVSDNGI